MNIAIENGNQGQNPGRSKHNKKLRAPKNRPAIQAPLDSHRDNRKPEQIEQALPLCHQSIFLQDPEQDPREEDNGDRNKPRKISLPTRARQRFYKPTGESDRARPADHQGHSGEEQTHKHHGELSRGNDERRIIIVEI